MPDPIPHELRSLRLFFLAIFGMGAVLPLFGRLPLGLAFLALGSGGTLVLHRMQKCEESEDAEFIPASVVFSVLKALGVVVVFLFCFFHLAVPNLNGVPRSSANESAAIATLRNIVSAQLQYQAMGAIDRDGDGEGEYGYFADLAGANPPCLSGSFATIHAHASIPGGVVIRSGYFFQMFLPDAGGQGVPEAGSGGIAVTSPDVDRAERSWCCYAWPTSHGDTGKRAFFVNQASELIMSKNLARRYSGSKKAPTWDAAFLRGAARRLASTIAANATGLDGQAWSVVH